MAQCTFTGPVRIGDTAEGSTPNVGGTVLSQSVTLTQNSTTAVSGTMYLPSGSVITSILIDNLTQWNSATSAVLSVGTAAAGTQYVGSVDAKAAGRVTPTYTSAQVTAMNGIGSNTSVVATVTPTGATSAGVTKVTLYYVLV
jgi:hypothetical protein